MYKITDTFKTNKGILITFVALDIDKKIKTIRMYGKDDSVFEINDFEFGEFTQCFTSNQTRGFMTKANIPERYLQHGNELEFIN